jgi:hypothetical protein
MGVDVEIGIRNEAEILVFFAMEVEGYTITTNKSRILAYRTWLVAVCAYPTYIN